MIVIDSGHGGGDYGASGNGINEKDYTLLISKYMKERFDELGTICRIVIENLQKQNSAITIKWFVIG